MILSPDIITEIQTFLKPSDFYNEKNALICKTIFDLADNTQQIDFDVIISALSSNNLLETVGGYEAILSLEELVYDPELGKQHAHRVLDKSHLRQFINQVSLGIHRAIKGNDEPAKIIIDTQEKLDRLGFESSDRDFVQLNEISSEVKDDIRSRLNQHHGVSGLRTGFTLFDEKTGGLQKSDLIILAARPSIGKTAFALKLAFDIASGRAYMNSPNENPMEYTDDGKAVGVFSLEMARNQVFQRILSYVSNVPMYKLRTGEIMPHELKTVEGHLSQLSDCPFYIDDTASISITELRAKAKRLKMRCHRDAEATGNPNRELSLLVIDYLQLMQGRTDKRQESRQQEVSEISRSLKELARDLNIPIIALSQLSREIERRKGKNAKPQLSDLRESGAIEQDADVVLFLHREKTIEDFSQNNTQQCPTENAELIISKQRNGPIGSINLLFFKETATFMANTTEGFKAG